MEERKILAIFGGSFNPPLNSHFLLAEQIYNEIENIEKVIFLPVSSKYEKNDLLSNEHRYNMLKSVIDKNEHFEELTDFSKWHKIIAKTYEERQKQNNISLKTFRTNKWFEEIGGSIFSEFIEDLFKK